MIDFELTENDQAILSEVRSQALICRKYARECDEQEEESVPGVAITPWRCGIATPVH